MSNFPLPDTITYFLVTGNDGLNSLTYAAGVKVKARIAKRERLVYDDEGKEQRTQWAIYTSVEIPQKAYVFIGDAEGQTTLPDGARTVKSFSGVGSATNLRRILI